MAKRKWWRLQNAWLYSLVAPLAFHATSIDGAHTHLHTRLAPTTCWGQRKQVLSEGTKKVFLVSRGYFKFVTEITYRVFGITPMCPFHTQHACWLVKQQSGSSHLGWRGVGLFNRTMQYAFLITHLTKNVHLSVSVHILDGHAAIVITCWVEGYCIHTERIIPIPTNDVRLIAIRCMLRWQRNHTWPSVVIDEARFLPVVVSCEVPHGAFKGAIA